jgi:hypothetical protein
MYRWKRGGIEVFLVHPGGPYWAKKDLGAWTIPKGEYDNDEEPYRHWHVICAAWSQITLACSCKVPEDIDPVEHNPVIRCQHCKDSRHYVTNECFLAPISVATRMEKASGNGRGGGGTDRSGETGAGGI